MIDGQPYAEPGNTATAGFDGTLPDGPKTYADMHPAAWDATARVAFMDEQHIRAQVLYPDLGGFGAGAVIAGIDPARPTGSRCSRHSMTHPGISC